MNEQTIPYSDAQLYFLAQKSTRVSYSLNEKNANFIATHTHKGRPFLNIALDKFVERKCR